MLEARVKDLKDGPTPQHVRRVQLGDLLQASIHAPNAQVSASPPRNWDMCEGACACNCSDCGPCGGDR